MSIAAPINRAAQVRKLHADGLTAEDIAHLTGYHIGNVRLALKRKPKDKPRSRAPALTAGQVAEKTGMPLSAARLLVR